MHDKSIINIIMTAAFTMEVGACFSSTGYQRREKLYHSLSAGTNNKCFVIYEYWWVDFRRL